MTAPGPKRGGRLHRLIRKEVREILRDRRTIFTLVLMPVLVYPMLNLVFQRFLLSSLTVGEQPQATLVAFESESDARRVMDSLVMGWRAEHAIAHRGNPSPPQVELPKLDRFVSSDVEASLRSLDVDLAVRIVNRSQFRPLQLELLHRTDSPKSRKALVMFENSLRALNQGYFVKALERAGMSSEPLASFRDVAIESVGTASTLSALVPLILIMMTVTGAVYPAIDLTAGERERRTLETLFAAPVSRFGLLLAKYTAVVMVALLTAVVNLTAMTATLYAGGLSSLVFGDEGLTLSSIAAVFLLLVLFAAFFSAVLLMITSSARSFKEAQAYLIPLMLVSLGPGLISLLPGIELTPWLAVTPLVNVVLVARDIFKGEPFGILGLVALAATIAYTAAAIWAAARVFGQDAVGGEGSARTHRRPDGTWTAPSRPAAAVCLALLIPSYYLLGGWLAQLQGLGMGARLLLAALVTGLIFRALPWAACVWERVPVGLGLRLHRAPLTAWLAAAVLGLSIWPFAHEIIRGCGELGLYTLDELRLKQVEDMLRAWRALPPLLVLACMALAPAVFEELFFRGYLFRAWENHLRPAALIASTAVVFGAFHIISGHTLTPERFLPSALIGLFLGWTALKTGSVLPGILLHFCNNGLLISVAYYQEDLTAGGWDLRDQTRIPLWWLGVAALAILLGLALLSPFRSRLAGKKPLVNPN